MKKPKIVKFSISMRQEVQQMLDQLAFQEGRTRSNMIEYLCKKGLQPISKQEVESYTAAKP